MDRIPISISRTSIAVLTRDNKIDDISSRFHRIQVCDGQTPQWTDLV